MYVCNILFKILLSISKRCTALCFPPELDWNPSTSNQQQHCTQITHPRNISWVDPTLYERHVFICNLLLRNSFNPLEAMQKMSPYGGFGTLLLLGQLVSNLSGTMEDSDERTGNQSQEKHCQATAQTCVSLNIRSSRYMSF